MITKILICKLIKGSHLTHGSYTPAKGLTAIAEASDLSCKRVQKALSENGNPQFGSVKAIMHTMGYRLAPEKLPQATPSAARSKAL
jgi:DNA-binding phage protein